VDAPNQREIAPAVEREARSGNLTPSGPHEPKASGERQSRAGSSPVLRTSFTTLQRRRRRRYGTRGPDDHFVPRLLALDAAKQQNNEHLQRVLLLFGSSPVLRASFTTSQRRRWCLWDSWSRYEHFVPRLLALDAAKQQNNEHLQRVLLLFGASPVLRTTFVEGAPWRLFFVLLCCYEQARL